jgi:hypothetical protein
MIAQLDSPVVAQAGALGGGAFAAQKWGYMKDPVLAADIDIFGAFGATDANVPDMRKPDQIWVRSSSLYNNKLLFESGTGNHADASSLGYPDDNFTARFAVLTARSQLEKILFKREMMEENEAILLGNSNQFTPNESSTQEERLQWLEENTLPSVYWDARVGEQYSEGSSNNVRFWSAATGNCLPAPCVFDQTSPIAAYLNGNNDIYKNDVRVAIKKWISEEQTSAIETAYQKLSSIYFTPVARGERIPLFADPDILIGWYDWETGYQTTAQQYIKRILKAATPYTFISYASEVFGNGQDYVTGAKYYDAVYGVNARAGEQSPSQQVFTNGIRGGKSLPPFVSRAVMHNIEYDWLSLFGHKSATHTNADLKPFFGNGFTEKNGYLAEFARQANMGLNYMFPEEAPIGGLTPGSPQSGIDVYRKVGARLWNDLSDYSKNNSTIGNTAKYVIHHGSPPNAYDAGVIRSGIRYADDASAPPYRSYWRGNPSSEYAIPSYKPFIEIMSNTAGSVQALHASQVSADAVSVGYWSTNRFPIHPDWAEGATFWFSDEGNDATRRKLPDGSNAPSDYSYSDTLYWLSKELSTSIGYFKKALVDTGSWKTQSDQKVAAVITTQLFQENGTTDGFTPFTWNGWSGSRKDPVQAGQMEAIGLFANRDAHNPLVGQPDQVWIWDSARYYWISLPTTNTASADANTKGVVAWARNSLEKVLFGRPEYPTAYKELLESDGLSMAANPSAYGRNVRERQRDWLMSNYLGDEWWVTSNTVWYQSGTSQLPSPCVLSQDSPLAPWLNFGGTITTTDVQLALRHYISDYNCQFVESVRETLDRIQNGSI